MGEAVLAHSQGDDHTFLRPVERDGTAELRSHAPVHQLASAAYVAARRCFSCHTGIVISFDDIPLGLAFPFWGLAEATHAEARLFLPTGVLFLPLGPIWRVFFVRGSARAPYSTDTPSSFLTVSALAPTFST